MKKGLSLEDENTVTLMLVQALIGSVATNFRMVCLHLDEFSWKITFFLEDDQAEDREEIEDVVGEFDAMSLHLEKITDIDLEVEVNVGKEVLAAPGPTTRVVFKRKEWKW